MRIIHVVPGSGGTFYCENCLRDLTLVRALKRQGHDVLMVPMYLPLFLETASDGADAPVFFGAVSLYLEERFPALRRAPRLLRRLLDSKPMLAFAARRAGSTDPTGLEDMTLSMLRGEHGRQARDLEQLVAWLANVGRPDVVHLSNALLLGLARQIRERLGVPVVCSLQDEDTWLNAMEAPYAEQTWAIMRERAGDIAAFIAVSRYYGELMRERMGFPLERLHTVHVGIDLEGRDASPLPMSPPVIGYLSRLAEPLGLGVLADAFVRLKRRPELAATRLVATGGSTPDDKPFLKRLARMLRRAGVAHDVTILPEFDRERRLAFLSSLTVMSVPVPRGEAFGVYLVEAAAAGVPVVQPRVGAFPEIVEATGGGVVYDRNDADGLCTALAELLGDPNRLRELGRRGRERAQAAFGVERMTASLLEVYEGV